MQDRIPCWSFKCKEGQETEPRSQTVVDVNPTGSRKGQRTWMPLSHLIGRATARRLLCGMFRGIWRKDVYFWVATTEQH